MKLQEQELPAMLDTGANPNCISKRCVEASDILRVLPRHPYSGKNIVDANGQPLKPLYVLKCHLQIGSPTLMLPTELIVIEYLPFSCIIGQKTLRTFTSWEISNSNRLLYINKKHVVPFYDNETGNNIQLLSTTKTIIEPYNTVEVDLKAYSTDLNAFRPYSHINILVEGNVNFCNRLSLEVVPSINTVTHQHSTTKVKIFNNSCSPKTITKGAKLACGTSRFEELEYNGVNTILDDPVEILCDKIKDLSESEFRQARALLREYKDVFTVSNNHIGRTDVMEFDVDSDIDPVTVPLRRVPMHHREIVQELLHKYENLHLIEPVDSPFRASTVLVKKKNVSNSTNVTDQYRLCTDYRALNNHISSSGWPAPSLDECLDSVGNSDMFSALDFNCGYHQIPCSDNAKQTLAFSPGYGFKQYTWSVMPQGVKSASNCFQQSMLKTFENRNDCILPPYYDDVIIKSKGFRNHLRNTRMILNDIREAKFTLNALKCSFFQRSIHYLGHVISENKVQMDPKRTDAILKLPTPCNVRSLRSFIGMVQFCHKFVKDLNIILTPLYKLLQAHQKFIWSNECEAAFQKLKEILSSPPVLYSPSKNDRFILETDASDLGLGGCLKAVSCNNVEHVVGYLSKKFSKSECNWNIVEKETFAITYGVRYFRHFLIGKSFIIRCDNRIVSYLKDKSQPRNKKMLNWALELSEYDYVVQHIPSKNNNISDTLSRLLPINPRELHLTLTPQSTVNSVNDTLINNQESSLIKDAQATDPECYHAMKYLSKNRKNFDVSLLGSLKRYRKLLSEVDGILLWKNRYVVPNSLRSRILQYCHDHPMSGHFAIERTHDRFCNKFFWPKALEDVERYVKSCSQCNQFNHPRSYVKAPLIPIQTDKRFQFVCYDLAGPFTPVTIRGNRYALIIVDHYTHWPEFVALHNTEAPTIATALIDNWCCRYGIPDQFHSDGASNVHGSITKELCKRLGIGKTKSSRLHPQGDGMAENYVKQLKSCIQKQVEENGSNWDLFLQMTAFAIRTNTNYSTGFSPAELMIGSKLEQPVDTIVNLPKTYSEKQAQIFANDLKKNIEQSNKIVRQQLFQSREKMKNHYDKTTKTIEFNVGDKVMLWKPYKKKNLSKCFQPNWNGPWEIKLFTNDSRTNCKLVNDNGKMVNVHINQLKRVETRQPDTNNQPQTIKELHETPPVFDHYLDDFEEDDNNVVDDSDDNDSDGDIINYGWTNVDTDNILPNRTRGGVRLDYSD